jgi:CubicO group peptidase (beta-lactamase class C family)
MSMTSTPSPQAGHPSTGTVREGLEAVREQFDAYLLADPNYSAQLAIYQFGEPIVDLTGGPHLAADSVTGVFSSTKGVAAITLATLVEDGLLDLDEMVVHYWPEFAPFGKDRVTVRQLLSHRAGLINTATGLDPDDILLDSRRAAEQLAAARPLWRPGAAFGYHGLTIGTFMEELVRRVTGDSLQRLYEQKIRAPRNIDFYLGLPEDQDPRYQPVLPPRPTAAQLATFTPVALEPDGHAALMMSSVNKTPDLTVGPVSPNRREVRAVGAAGAAGVGSARGLASVYAAALGHLGEPLLCADTIADISQQQCYGHDRVLNETFGYAMVFQIPQSPRLAYGSYRAFGHDGAGGAIGCADPMYDLAFGYIPAPLAYPGGADPKGVHLSQITRRILAGLQ